MPLPRPPHLTSVPRARVRTSPRPVAPSELPVWVPDPDGVSGQRGYPAALLHHGGAAEEASGRRPADQRVPRHRGRGEQTAAMPHGCRALGVTEVLLVTSARTLSVLPAPGTVVVLSFSLGGVAGGCLRWALGVALQTSRVATRLLPAAPCKQHCLWVTAQGPGQGVHGWAGSHSRPAPRRVPGPAGAASAHRPAPPRPPPCVQRSQGSSDSHRNQGLPHQRVVLSLGTPTPWAVSALHQRLHSRVTLHGRLA